MDNRVRHLWSEKRNATALLFTRVNTVRGIETASVDNIPAVTAADVSSTPRSALNLVIIRDTVIGIPEDVAVIKSPSTDRDIWYSPRPSAPSFRDKKIL